MKLLQELALLLPALAAAASVSVTYPEGTVLGSTDTTTGVDVFRGIPFAEPPVGPLRLRKPQRLQKTLGSFDGTNPSRNCPQFDYSTYPDEIAGLGPSTAEKGVAENSPEYQASTNQTEDCLQLDIYRPANTTADDKLPVLFWIYGGGFQAGSINGASGNNFITASVARGDKIIYVAANYRLNAFGFLGGAELQKEGSTNLGLRDQRLAMEWVQENIDAFGGDPEKVTIWGESAGSISVFDHLIINDGNHTSNGAPLFRAAIMNSGSVIPTQNIHHPIAQSIYNRVVENAGCLEATDSLACLRSVNYTAFREGATSVNSSYSYRSIDLSYLPRPDPSDSFFAHSPDFSLLNGLYARVPVIIGDLEDEGTYLGLPQFNITTADQLIDYFKTYFPDASRDQVASVVNTYSTDPADGSPFGTGTQFQVYPQFKRLAAIIGDLTFTLTRRIALRYLSTSVPAWTFLGTFNHGESFLGTQHGADVTQIYGGQSFSRDAFINYYLGFVSHLDPNHAGASTDYIAWPQWCAESVDMLEIGKNQTLLIKDDFRNASYAKILELKDVLKV